ncbi:MAG: glutaredoxin family protein [Actinobacteria bacterium]|nr:glutaredoxin family protein [Actinomycetota bacterium]
MPAEIKVYTTPTCSYCVQVKNFLSERGIVYEEKNVAVDLDARQEMVDLSGQMGVPVIKIDSEIIVGFNREKLEQLLKVKS